MGFLCLAVALLAALVLLLERKARRFLRCPLVTAEVRSVTPHDVYVENGRVRDDNRSYDDVLLGFALDGVWVERHLRQMRGRRPRYAPGERILFRYDPRSGQLRPEREVQRSRSYRRIAWIVLAASLLLAGGCFLLSLWNTRAAALLSSRLDLAGEMLDPLLVGAAGAAMFLYGILQLRRRNAFFRHLRMEQIEEIPSVCVEYARTSDGESDTYYPVLEYLWLGRPVRWQSQRGFAAMRYRIGETVPLYRDRETGRCELKPGRGHTAAGWLLVLLGAACLLLALGGALLRLWEMAGPMAQG